MTFFKYSLLLSTALLFNFSDCLAMKDNGDFEENKSPFTNKLHTTSKSNEKEDDKAELQQGEITPSQIEHLEKDQEEKNKKEGELQSNSSSENTSGNNNSEVPSGFSSSNSDKSTQEEVQKNSELNTTNLNQNLFEISPNEISENKNITSSVFNFSPNNSFDFVKRPERKTVKVPSKKNPEKSVPNNNWSLNQQINFFSDMRRDEIGKRMEYINILWNKIPKEVKAQIFEFLDTESLIKCRLVNREMNAILKEKTKWKSLKAYWPMKRDQWNNTQYEYSSESLHNFRNILKFKIKSLSLINFLPNDLIYSDISNNTEYLTEIDLSQSSKTTDDCLFYFSDFKKLKKLNLAGLPISDKGLAKLHKLENIEVLNVSNAQITGNLFQYLNKSAKSLKSINLDMNRVRSFNIPLKNILNFSALEELYLAGYQLTDSDMQVIQHIYQLKKLDLSKNNISDNELNYIKNLTNLTYLGLSNTQVTIQGLIELGTSNYFSNLEELYLNNTQVGDAGIFFLDNFEGLKHIELKNTKVRNNHVLDYYSQISKTKIKDIFPHEVRRIKNTPETNKLPNNIHRYNNNSGNNTPTNTLELKINLINTKNNEYVGFTTFLISDNDLIRHYQNLIKFYEKDTGKKIIIE